MIKHRILGLLFCAVVLAGSVHAEISLPEITTTFNTIEELPVFMNAPEVLTTENSWDVDFPNSEQVGPGEKLKIQVEIKQAITGNASFVVNLNAKQKQDFKLVSANTYQTEIFIPATLPLQEYHAEVTYYLDGKKIDTKTIFYEVARRLTEVVVTGNFHVTTTDVFNNILSQSGDFPNPVKLAADRQRLESLGYFESVETRLEQKDKAYRLIFFLTENPIIQDIKIEGLSAFSKEKVLDAFNLKIGQIYVAQTLQQDLKTLTDLYEQDGYFLYKLIDFEPPSAANGNVVSLKISEGRINQITLAGNDNTKDYVILREMKLKKGSVVNQNSLKNDLRKIFNLNYFANVEPQLKPSQVDSSEVDLEIRVTEKKTSTLSLGIGYSEFTGTTGLVDLFLDNLWGTGQSVLFKTQFGGLYNSFQFRYSTPWIGDDPTSFTGRLWSTDQRNYITYDREWRSGFGVTFGRFLGDNWRGSVSLGAENIHIADVASRNGVLNNTHDYSTRTFGVGISYDTRDYNMNPHEGVFHSFNITKSLAILGGSVDYWILSPQANFFYPVMDKHTLATRVMVDLGYGQLQESDEFFVGSDRTVRGYSVFAQGRERYIANIEYRIELNEILQFVTFVDAGGAFNTISPNFSNPSGFKIGKGLGLRINTPLGPIRLDLGWGDGSTGETSRLHFSIGQTF